MKKTLAIVFLVHTFLVSLLSQTQRIFAPGASNRLRAPAYPLITMDPYISTWSFTDMLYGDIPRHWTKTARPLTGALRVDGKIYRFMGMEELNHHPVVFTGDIENWNGLYIQQKPQEGWEKPDFDASGWREGKAPYTLRAVPPATNWNRQDIWVRREFILEPGVSTENLMLQYSVDDFAEFFINGIPVIRTDSTPRMNQIVLLSGEVIKSLIPGKNLIAAHGHNATGVTLLDFGLVRKSDSGILFSTTASQKSVNVLPLQTWYSFDCGPVSLDLIFTSPLLQDDLSLFSRPVNYITWQARSKDGKEHSVQIYVETTPEWAVNNIGQEIKSERYSENGITFLKSGSVSQPVLEKRGDDLRIDWGYYYMAGKEDLKTTMAIGKPASLKKEFIKRGRLKTTHDNTLPGKMYHGMTALAMTNDLGKVGNEPVSGYVMIGYDDLHAIQYFGENLMALWKKNGKVSINQVFSMAALEYEKVMQRCITFDRQMMADAEKAGGRKYAELCAAVYRQSVAAHKLVSTKDDELLFLSKENTSNGCINTVDVTYPSAPLYLAYNTDLLKGMLNGIFHYAETGKWKYDFAPHDLGYYPIANGQVNRDDGSERLMPVEESGNMLVLTAVICYMDGNASYAEKHWKMLTQWADYLLQNGLDPANQLCTDDFAGHLAHNANLSIKAIMGIAGYAKMAEMLGKGSNSVKYFTAARKMAHEWVTMAKEDDHYKLAFDQSGTWSQKYNLAWDIILQFNIFPENVAREEMEFYLKKQLTYGLPLDSRKTYTKNDWVMWTAVLAADSQMFDRIIDPIWKYVNETPTRLPVSDWHETKDGRSVGMIARSVVGGYFMKLLEHKISQKQSYKPVKTVIETQWASKVNPENAWKEYPRPQLVRDSWINLNGMWDYAVRKMDASRPSSFDGKILVPFSIEAPLSGIGKQVDFDDAIWYKRQFDIPEDWKGKRIILHFEASDFETTVWVNDRLVGSHKGGYDSFSFDISAALSRERMQQIDVRVNDPQLNIFRSVGKQTRNKEYENCSGIWQTVWLEPLSFTASIASVVIDPSLDAVNLSVKTEGAIAGLTVRYDIFNGTNLVASYSTPVNTPLKAEIPGAKQWSPESPFLYDLKITLLNGNKVIDKAMSYFGLRTIGRIKTPSGEQVLLNGRQIFQIGPLDQNYWPEGGLTPPSDSAMLWEAQYLKRIGCNMVRLHIKVNPDRYYYHADKVGLLVWQDFVCGPHGNKAPSRKESDFWLNEQKIMMETLHNHPSIVTWVVFNESWGQHDSERIISWAEKQDESRLVIGASGWIDAPQMADIRDIHDYTFRPAIPVSSTDKRILMLGECGGFASAVQTNNWLARTNGKGSPANILVGGFSPSVPRDDNEIHDIFRPTFTHGDAFARQYDKFIDHLNLLRNSGLCGAVYTQMTDMRYEENGWLTFDRKVSKADEEKLAAMHGKLNSKPPVQKLLISPSSSWQVSIADNSVPRSEKRDSSLAARLQAYPDFNSMKWISGRAPFANSNVSRGSLWDGEKQLFMRKTFNLFSIPENASVRVYTRLEGKGIFWIYSRIFINGKFVADESTRQIMPENRIAEVILPDEAIALLRKGENQITVQFFPGFSSRDAVFGNQTENITVDVALTTFEQQ